MSSKTTTAPMGAAPSPITGYVDTSRGRLRRASWISLRVTELPRESDS